MRLSKVFSNGILNENPTFRLVLGMCPTLAVTTSVASGIGMGVATIFVLLGSNLVTSMLRNFIPSKVRIPAYIVIVATFVTIVGMVMQAFFPAIYQALGIFIPLIVVNCIVLARIEVFASKNPVAASSVDALGMGVGFTLALLLLASIREILGSGSWLGFNVTGALFEPAIIMLLPPGAFIALGLMMALLNKFTGRVEE
jgi:electron transport complex protein RnfE